MAKNKPMSKPMLDSVIEKPNSKYGGLYLNVNEAQLENSKNLLIELKKREAELRKNKKLKTFTVSVFSLSGLKQLIVFAKIRAVVVLPTPLGPVNK
jgi:hypothetical protein